MRKIFGLNTRKLRKSYFGVKLLLWKIIRYFRKSVTISTRQGVFSLSLEVNDYISKSLYCYDEYELELISKILAFLRSINKIPEKGGGTILDIGANNGVISIGMLFTNEVERAIAIEPEPLNYSILLQNIKLNNFEDKIITLPYAASDRKGKLDFELSPNNFGDHRVRVKAGGLKPFELFDESNRNLIQVEADKLDNILGVISEAYTKDISIIWIDVQGYEGYVILGAKGLLTKDVPVVSEIWPYGLLNAGFSKERFCDLAMEIWSNYCVIRNEKIIKYPINTFDKFYDELGYDGKFENVIFLK